MASEWDLDVLGNVCRIRYGKDHKQLADGKIPVYGSGGVMRHVDTALYDKKSVLIPRKGSLDNLYLVDGAFWTVDTLFYTEINEERVLPEFIYYQLLTLDLKNMNVGSAVPSLTTEVLNDIPVKLPPLPEQRAIASILGAFDDKIEVNRQIARTLENMARALFTSWFVRFDPVRAKAEGRQPEGMNAATADLFPSEFVASELGEIPAGWRSSEIGEEVVVVGGSTPSTKEDSFWGGDIAFATPKDLSGLGVPWLLDTERHITDAGLARISSGLLLEGTVLMSSRAPIGYLAIAGCPVAVNQGFIAMRCEKELSNYFVLLWAKQTMPEIESHANGSTFMEISKKAFRPISVVVPSPSVLAAFDQMVEPMFDEIRNRASESQALVAIRDTLLPKLMSGGFV